MLCLICTSRVAFIQIPFSHQNYSRNHCIYSLGHYQEPSSERMQKFWRYLQGPAGAMAECRITGWKWFIAVFLLFCHVWHCTAAFTGNAGALWRFVIKFPTPVSWRLTFSLLTVYSLLLCLPCAALFIFSSYKGQQSISECCFCSVPVHVLLSVIQYCVIDLATLIFWRWNGATAPSLPH